MPGTTAGMTRTTAHDLAILASLPLLLVLFNDYWGFTSTQSAFIDPWLYVARFLHPKTQLMAFPTGYYGDRLSYTIPGALLYHALGPWMGNYALKLVQIYTTVFALYFLIHRLFNRRTALFCCALICVHPYFLASFGWDYVNGAGLAYCALTLMLILRAAQSPSYRLDLILAGACCVSLLTTHLLWLSLAWMFPLVFYVANRNGSKHPLAGSLIAFLFGGFAVFCFYCGIYHSITGRWFYLMNTAAGFLNAIAKPTHRLVWPVRNWISRVHWLDHYFCLLPLSLWLLARREKPVQKTIGSALFVGAFSTMWVSQWMGFGFPNAPEYASFLFPAYLMAVAALVTDRVSAISQRGYACLISVTLAVGAAFIFLNGRLWALASPLESWVSARPCLEPVWGQQVLIVSALGLLLTAFICSRLLGSGKALSLYTTGMVLVFSLQLAIGVDPGWFSGTSDYSNKQGFQMLLEGDAWIHQRRENRRLLFWYDENEPRQGIVVGLSSLFEWGYSLLNTRLPGLTADDRQKLAAQPHIVCVSWRPERLQEARSMLASSGLVLASWEETTIRSAGLQLHLGFAQLKPGASSKYPR